MSMNQQQHPMLEHWLTFDPATSSDVLGQLSSVSNDTPGRYDGWHKKRVIQQAMQSRQQQCDQ